MTTLKRCPRRDEGCKGAVAYFRDERSDIPGEWKCLSCSRSFASESEMHFVHIEQRYPWQLDLWSHDPVIER